MSRSAASELPAIASAVEVPVDGAPAKRIKLLPYGSPFFGRNGAGPYILEGKSHAERVIAATRAYIRSCSTR